MGFETFEHGADVGIRGVGRSLEEAFEEVAKALFSIMVDISRISVEKEIKVEVSAPDLISLMVFWLNRLLTQADLNSMVFTRFFVEIEMGFNGYKLNSKNLGGKIDFCDEIGVEVKGVTFSEAKVFKEGNRWIAQCIVDV